MALASHVALAMVACPGPEALGWHQNHSTTAHLVVMRSCSTLPQPYFSSKALVLLRTLPGMVPVAPFPLMPWRMAVLNTRYQCLIHASYYPYQEATAVSCFQNPPSHTNLPGTAPAHFLAVLNT